MFEEALNSLEEESKYLVRVTYQDVKYSLPILPLFKGQAILNKISGALTLVMATYADTQDPAKGVLFEDNTWQDVSIAFAQALTMINTEEVAKALLSGMKVNGELVESIDEYFARNYALFYEILYLSFQVNFGEDLKKLLRVIGLPNLSLSFVQTKIKESISSKSIMQSNNIAPSPLSNSESSE